MKEMRRKIFFCCLVFREKGKENDKNSLYKQREKEKERKRGELKEKFQNEKKKKKRFSIGFPPKTKSQTKGKEKLLFSILFHFFP